MQTELLDASPVGRLVPIRAPDPASQEVTEAQAFLPDPLPAEIPLSTRSWTAINNATAALARLDGAARLIPSPGLLRIPTLRREAQSTSALEGTYAPFADVLAADLDDGADMSSEMHEILNFQRIAEEAFAWPEERPITLGALGGLQGMLVQGTAGALSDAGGLRDRIVVVGKPGSGFAEARFVPPPPGDQLKAGAEELIKWMNEPPDIPTVLQAAMAHYQFETLHPYSDGNGRLGRLLVIVQLLRGHIIREPLLVVSPWFEQRRERYQDALLELSCTGAWDPWVAFFAEGVAASASESQHKVERLVALGDQLRRKVGDAGKRGAAERIAGELVGTPYVTAPQIARAQGLTWQGATNAIRALVDLGILEPVELRSNAATYVAPAVLNVLLA